MRGLDKLRVAGMGLMGLALSLTAINATAQGSRGVVLDPVRPPIFDHILVHPEGGGFIVNAFGPSDASILSLQSAAFVPNNHAVHSPLLAATATQRYCTGDCIVDAAISLPSGAQITSMTLDLRDSANNASVRAELLRCPVTSVLCNLVGALESGTVATPGTTQLSTALDHTVLNGSNYYIVEAFLDASANTAALTGVQLFWKRQISPAPGVASFTDVPTNHMFFQAIEALAASGVTQGCGFNIYCPDSPVTRGQMAAFLSRALGLHYDGT